MSHALTASELDDIRSSYEEELAGLTINSKPIINMLTTIAQENMNAASVICKTIEDRIRSKLPVMYLLDSISKNVGSPFTPIFGRNLYKTFMDCYTAVDSQTRRPLEALFSTWKLPVAGSSTLVPVYPLEDTRRIDEALLRIRAVQERNPAYYQQYQHMAQNYHHNSPYPGQMFSSMPSHHGFADMARDPYRQSPPAPFHMNPDISSQTSIPGSNLTAEAVVADIVGLLRNLDTRARLDPTDATITKFIMSLRGLYEVLTTQNLHLLQLEDIRNSLRDVAVFCAQPLRSIHRSTSPPAHPFVAQPAPLDLFAQLAKAGILPASGSNTPVPNTLLPQPRSFAFVELRSTAMLQSRPEFIDILYASMPLQCYQCGQRWRDTPADRTAKDEHLDWHFKVNKRLREHSVRAQSRALYLSEADWVHFSVSEEEEVEHREGLTKTGSDPSLLTIPKPTDPALHDSVCPICKESFVTDWDDSSENWVWKNAVDIDGVIYHGLCHAEALSTQNKNKQANTVSRSEVKLETHRSGNEMDGDDDEDIVLPSTTDQSQVEQLSSATQIPIKSEFTPTVGDPGTPVPFVLEDALRSLSGTLNSIAGIKRKASEEAEDGNERRVKIESDDA